MPNRPILIMAGGTGGHVYPALAVADYLREAGVPVMWLGTSEGIESRVVTVNGYELVTVTVSGIRGKGVMTFALAPFMIIKAIYQSLRIIIRIKPAAVLGMGGYVSGPGGIATFLAMRPLLIHEQNSVAGLTNRLLAPFAKVIMQGFPNAFKGKKNTVVTGNPVRNELRNITKPELRYSQRDEKKLKLLVLGGSQGARVLNETIPEAINHLPPETKLEVIHQCGKGHIEKTQALYSGLNEKHNIKVLPFIDDMLEVYTWADLVVCRSGAMTIAEICVVGLASILVPFRFAVDDHQTSNGKYLYDSGGALMISELDCSHKHLARLIDNFYKNPSALKEMACKSRMLAEPEAAENVGRVCMEVIHA